MSNPSFSYSSRLCVLHSRPIEFCRGRTRLQKRGCRSSEGWSDIFFLEVSDAGPLWWRLAAGWQCTVSHHKPKGTLWGGYRTGHSQLWLSQQIFPPLWGLLLQVTAASFSTSRVLYTGLLLSFRFTVLHLCRT